MIHGHVLDLMNYLFKVRNVSLKTIYELMNGLPLQVQMTLKANVRAKAGGKRDTAWYNGGFFCTHSTSSEALT